MTPLAASSWCHCAVPKVVANTSRRRGRSPLQSAPHGAVARVRANDLMRAAWRSALEVNLTGPRRDDDDGKDN